MYARDSSWVWAVRECAFLLSGKFVKGMVTRFCSDADSRFGMCLQRVSYVAMIAVGVWMWVRSF